jgi:copper resistance protein D
MNIAVAGFAAAGLAARPLTGHFSESALGGLAVALHTLAAALWCGALAGLVLTVEHRGQWPACCRGSRSCRCRAWQRC